MLAQAREMPSRTREATAGGRRGSWLTAAGRRYFLLVYSLVVLGLVFVFSSSYPFAGRPTPRGGDPYHYFRAQLAYAAAGLVAMLALAKLPIRSLGRWRWTLGALVVGWGLMLAAIIYGRFFGHEVNGAYCWLPWPIMWQPSEFAKIAFIVFVAGRLAVGPLPRERNGRVWIPIFGATLFTALLLVGQKDLGMAVVVVAVTLGMALIGGMRLRNWVPLTLSVGALGLLVARGIPHAWHRIEVWLHPEQFLQGSGLHVYNMLVALAHGGVWGQGLGVSQEKWSNLSERFTDSIYCVIGGELGLWGGIGVIALMVLLAVWAFQIARRCPHRLGFFIAAGLGLSFGLQGLVNIAVATACIPPTGLTLPFISYGGSSILSSLIGAGLILAVAAEERGRGDG
jgi:cell division protein FtsW